MMSREWLREKEEDDSSVAVDEEKHIETVRAL